MDTLVTIGEFSRLSHLSAKALRHYHDVGLLVPTTIDTSGYRRYGLGQVHQAQLIRRLRQLDMPVPDIKAVLAASDEQSRDHAIAEHLRRMEETLGRTTQVVASLRALLEPVSTPLSVEYRTVPELQVLAIRDTVRHQDITDWCQMAYPALYESLGRNGSDPAGVGGATYATAFFEQAVGEVVAYVPVAGPVFPSGRTEPATLPAGRFAVGLHQGSYTEIDRTYGALGSQVATSATAQPFPIREQYLIGPDHSRDHSQFRTEIWWPVSTHVNTSRHVNISRHVGTPTNEEN